MIRYIFLLVILFNIAPAWGQLSNGKISGIITDSLSGTSLELATASVFAKDSMLVNYQLSDKNGNFTIDKLPLNKELRLDISYVGYKSFKQNFRLDSTGHAEKLNIKLTVNLEDTNAVIVKWIVPIRMNGDTLEINPAAFKMEKTAVAEELLNQVPGITIWADGTITVNGRPVPKILVDGKPFLNQSDPTVATQNLPKSAIEKIQVYQEVDRTKEQRENTEQDSIFTMNIKLKADKKTGYFGKAGFGYGTDHRYEGDAAFQVYNKKNNLSIGGGINNINKSIGNLQQMMSNNTFRKMNPNIFNSSSFGRSGVNKTYSLGANYSHYFTEVDNGSEENTLTTNYNHSGNDNFVSNNTVQERTTKNFSQFIESSSNSGSVGRNHSAGIAYSKSKSRTRNFNLSANTEFSNNETFSNSFTSVSDSSKALQNTNSVSSTGESNSKSGALNFNLNNYTIANPVTRFSVNGYVNFRNSNSERNSKSIFDSYTDPSADTSYNRLYNNQQDAFIANLNLNYNGLRRLLFRRFNLFGIELGFVQGFNFSDSKTNAVVSDYDSSAQKFQQNNGLTNSNSLQTLKYNPTITFQKSFSKWTNRYNRNFSLFLRMGQNLQKEINKSTFAIRNVERSFSFFTPNFSISHNYGRRDKFNYNVNVGMGRNYSYPSVDQLYTITDSLNVYSVRFGNPNLKNIRTDNVNLNFSFNKRKPKAKYEIGASLNSSLNYKSNPIADSVINDVSGKRLMYYINADDGMDYNFNYSANISRKIRKNSIQLQYTGNMNNSRSANFIDGIESTNRNKSISHNINLQYSLNTLLILKLSKVISNYSSSQSGSGLASYNVKSMATQFGATLNVSKDFSFNTTVSTTDNSNVSNTIVLWHAFSSYRFLKDKQGELKFSAFDLLKKFQNINVNTNIDGTSTTVSNGLQQYFLLTFSYYPRKFGKKGSDD